MLVVQRMAYFCVVCLNALCQKNNLCQCLFFENNQVTVVTDSGRFDYWTNLTSWHILPVSNCLRHQWRLVFCFLCCTHNVTEQVFELAVQKGYSWVHFYITQVLVQNYCIALQLRGNISDWPSAWHVTWRFESFVTQSLLREFVLENYLVSSTDVV